MFRELAVRLLVVALGGVSLSAGNEIGIGRTAVLGATLPAGTTWQVESRVGTGAWVGSGVLVGGRGVAVQVRMDGWPGEAGYRFRRLDGAATVVPTLGAGWHLAGEAPGEEALVIEGSGDLSVWSPRELVFPGLNGSYVRALEGLPGGPGFFRSTVSETPPRDASATSHLPVPPYHGAGGFGPIYDDMPQIFKDGFIGALDPVEFHRGGQNAAAAGECYELAGPFGRTTVIISDTTIAPAGTVDVGRSFFDLGPEPYRVLSGGPSTGGVTAGVRLVPAPVTGNVKLFVVPTSASIYYTELRAYNHRAGVSKVELQNNGSTTWVNLPRSAYNSFVYQAAGAVPPMAFPVKLRVTSRFGEVVDFPTVLALTDNQKITGLAQFTVFPELAPVPEHRVRPVFHDALTNVPGDMWSSGGFSGASATQDASVAYSGSAASLRLSSLGGNAGVTFSNYPAFTRPENGMLKLAIRAASPVAANQVGLWITGSNAIGGGQLTSAYILFPPLSTNWQVLRFPLEASGAPPVTWGFGISGAVSGPLPNVWMDEVEFEER